MMKPIKNSEGGRLVLHGIVSPFGWAWNSYQAVCWSDPYQNRPLAGSLQGNHLDHKPPGACKNTPVRSVR